MHLHQGPWLLRSAGCIWRYSCSPRSSELALAVELVGLVALVLPSLPPWQLLSLLLGDETVAGQVQRVGQLEVLEIHDLRTQRGRSPAEGPLLLWTSPLLRDFQQETGYGVV